MGGGNLRPKASLTIYIISVQFLLCDVWCGGMLTSGFGARYTTTASLFTSPSLNPVTSTMFSKVTSRSLYTKINGLGFLES